MLVALFLVVATYLLAAESFTHFLFPSPGEVASHFTAGALPVLLFDIVIAAFALVIIMGWFLIYAKSHGRTIQTPAWVHTLQARLYLFLINRLYLDALSMRLDRRLTTAVRSVNASGSFPLVMGVIAVGTAWVWAERSTDVAMAEIALLLIIGLLLPLFPLHGVYIAALTRAPAQLAIVLAVLLPSLGMYGLTNLAPGLSAEALGAVRVLAVFGSLYGSLKALSSVRGPQLLAYAGMAFFSALWWYFAGAGTVSVQAVAYVIAATLIISALLFAWQRAERACGDLMLDKLHGLARPMPRFATMVSLLVMAAAGFPPFGLFSALVAMLLERADATSWDIIAILIAWFLASWYLFRMMQRLLFGPYRTDLGYRDLRSGELAGLAFLAAIVVLVGTAPDTLHSHVFLDGHRIVMETLLWLK
jgi:formate hydrogenlyase subunit 3/multisubunit Na+/H+ antiporter MnhD subunit